MSWILPSREFLLSALCSLVIIICSNIVATAESNPELSDEQVEFFESKIRPVLVQQCYSCHSAKAGEPKAGLMLDSRPAMHTGGDSGPAVVPGDIDASLILGAIRYDDFEMPPKEKLPAKVIADFEKWVKMGAPDPRDQVVSLSESNKFEAAKSFWSFQQPQRHAIPEEADLAWVKKPIDGFISAKMLAVKLAPNPMADRRTLLRRLSYDLKGLPPSMEELKQFREDDSPVAVEHWVEDYLNSPQFGERWARLWLDISHYGEDQAHVVGSNNSLFYPNAYLYRDWVIQAMNDDMPFDEFIRLQLAADLMETEEDQQFVALGFLGLGPKYYRRNDPEVMADEWEDRIDTVSRGLLGLTVACARCHDHKYDPIATEDYYALAGIFASTQMYNLPLDDSKEQGKDGQAKNPSDSWHIIKDGKPQDINVQIRGVATDKGAIVPRRFLSILSEDEPQHFKQGSGRLELANAIADRNNPLTARVFVNRVWGELFGQPLVTSTSNFGMLGDAPSHQELLDDLSVRFMESGWSLKWLIREIVLSSTYQQSSEASSQQLAIDPDNKLLSRMNRRKLDIEKWRDTILFVADNLDANIGGMSINPQDAKQTKRTIYSKVSRLELNKMLAMFDFPDPNSHSSGRNQSTTPLQKMFVLNSPFMVSHADALAARIISHSGPKTSSGVTYAYQLLYGRKPSVQELDLGINYLRAPGEDEEKRWQQYAQILLASNELLFVD
ncbi:MAG: hypothetical protein COA78_12470 [Blastopirellula sp.]|nr:MAG: hypothetical protein COA78_12470 [Blastopirellula sp.]